MPDLFLESRFAGLTMNEPYSINDSDELFQVMKAVEAAEATIKQQVEENNRLRSELQRKNDELEKYKSGDVNSQSGDRWSDQFNLENQIGGGGNMDINFGHVLPDRIRSSRDDATQTHIGNRFDSSMVNGSLNLIHGGRAASTQIMAPSITLYNPTRNQQEGNTDSEFRYSGRDLISVAEVNDTSTSKQDIAVKIQENEEEISQLKKHLAQISMKESQIHSEKYALEKRISYMRLAFDQQQQDLILAASKAISYRQDIMEENVRLTYALQAAQQERSTFVASLMPLLAEYSLQPPVADAQSIASNVKVLFRHLQEQLLVTEGKLKESEYQLAPWRSDEIKQRLELVPQQTYSDGKMPSSDSALVGDILGLPQSGENLKNLEHEELGRHQTLASRNTTSHEVSSQHAFGQGDPHQVRNNEGAVSKKVTFGDLVRSSELDELENRGQHNDREPSTIWNSNAAATTTMDDPNSSFSPYLPPVLEEPSSSFSEAADDDPLPAIEGLQISGEAFPGQQLQACGYSVNGTTSCNFEWVHHLDDGSFNYVEGAKQPTYLVTADDVDTYLAIEVQPLDDRKRKGELVKVFANDHRKITCDAEMQRCIEKTLYTGHASYKLSLSSGYLDIWEPATLTIKRDGYSIKCNGPSGGVVTEKFSSSINVVIPFGSPTEFSIVDSLHTEHILRVDNNLTDISGARDTIVLTLRLFIIKAGEKRRKKRSLFFNK